MNIARSLAVLVVLASMTTLVGCNEKGACVVTRPGGEGEICMEVKKSVCADGKDRFVGGTCKLAGFPTQNGNGWDKK